MTFFQVFFEFSARFQLFSTFFELFQPWGREAREPLFRLVSEFSRERPF